MFLFVYVLDDIVFVGYVILSQLNIVVVFVIITYGKQTNHFSEADFFLKRYFMKVKAIVSKTSEKITDFIGTYFNRRQNAV